ncbi:MAG: MFS transporter [Planctomycetota bacterium]|jgi:predicted MFS family arabinose efflux permease
MNRPFRPLLLAYIAAVQSAYVTPVLLGAATDSLHLRADEAGLLTTLELLGFAISGLVLAPRLDRLPRGRLAHAAVLVLGCAHVVSAAIDAFALLAIARSVAGLAAGSLMATTNAEIASYPDAEKKYARCSAVAVLFGCAGLFVIPFAARTFGHAGAYGYVGTLALLLVPGVWGWPAPQPLAERPERGDISALKPLFAFTLLLFFSDGVVYAFAERMGRALGMEGLLDALLSGALLAGFVGALAAGALGTRWGQIRPLVAAGCATALAGLAIPYATGAVTFGAAVSVKNLTLFFLFPYLLGAAAARDPSGRGVALTTAIVPLGVSMGPWVGGILVEAWGFPVLGWVGVAAMTLAAPFALRLRARG